MTGTQFDLRIWHHSSKTEIERRCRTWNWHYGTGHPVTHNGETRVTKSDAYITGDKIYVSLCGEIEPICIEQLKPVSLGQFDDEWEE